MKVCPVCFVVLEDLNASLEHECKQIHSSLKKPINRSVSKTATISLEEIDKMLQKEMKQVI